MENKIIIGLGKGRDGTVSLAKNIENIIQLNQSKYPVHHEKYVKEIYNSFTPEEISKKIAELITPEGIRSKVIIIYQSISDLHIACPNHIGDWYFTGNYPTPGGIKVVNKSFIRTCVYTII